MPPMKPETLPEMDAYRHNAAERQIGICRAVWAVASGADAVRAKGAVKKVPQQGSQCLKALATKN